MYYLLELNFLVNELTIYDLSSAAIKILWARYKNILEFTYRSVNKILLTLKFNILQKY